MVAGVVEPGFPR